MIATALSISFIQPTLADHVQYSFSENPYPLGRTAAAESNDCDKATAHAYDPWRRDLYGVKYADIDVPHAIQACQDWANSIIAKFETRDPIGWDEKLSLRAIYQMSRVISKQGDDATALEYNERADDLGYPYASYYLHLAHHSGWGTEKNPDKATTYLDKALTFNIPVAFKRRADIELAKDIPNFAQVKQDLHRARKGGLPLMLSWSKFHEKYGERILRESGEILREDATCYVKDCGDQISDLTEHDLILSFPYEGLRNYQTELNAAIAFNDDYLMAHPNDAFASETNTRLVRQLELVQRATKYKLQELR